MFETFKEQSIHK